MSDKRSSVTLTAYGPDELLGLHEHETAHLCLILSGSLVQAGAESDQRLVPGQVGLYPAGHRHRNVLGPSGACCLNLHVPASLAPEDFAILPVEPRLMFAAADLANCIAHGANPDTFSVDALLADLLNGQADAEPTAQFPLRKLLTTLAEAPDASLADVAERVGRHPTHVARAFRHATGYTLGAYRRRQRVRNLLLDLRTDDASLSELAARHGYSDQAHMTREFRAFTGQPPGAWRRTR